MADIKLHQALTPDEQKNIKRKDLDCLVKYVDKFFLEDAHLFGLSSFVFRYGMPAKFPNGEYGYLIYGDVGVHNKPSPKPGDYRVTQRALEVPIHEVSFSGIYRVQSKITEYYDRDRVELDDPSYWIAFHIAALSRAIPNYLSYIVYKMFVGTETAKENWYIKDWITTFIKPDNGQTNGYKFYNSEGWHTINLSEVITKTKVTEHKLDKKLDDINKALRNDTRKIEVEVDKDEMLKTKWISENVTSEGKKVLALKNKIEIEVQNAINNGYMDKKYKHKQEHFEGYNAAVNAGNLIILMSQKDINTLNREANLKQPFTGWLGGLTIAGVVVLVTALLDKGEALILHKDLIQCWVLPQLSKYWVDQFKTDETRDYIYEISHTIDLIDIYPSIWLKLKA